ncbi:putative phosphoglycerate mutase-like protein [metagenome]|uniref:Putative phosphoglycerate mutase-like protein n=1 Tax=metagenome TaxID=256318 RepID=A0A2P2C6T5_9ZZZZ
MLVVMRHAKAQQYAPTDHERELEPRGRRDAVDAGSWMALHEIECDYVLVSSAVRTIGTWEAVAEAADWDIDPDVDDSLYAAGPETALDVIRSLPDEATSVLLIGHNPTVAYLAQLLDDGDGDADSISEMSQGFPTCALTVFDYEGEWADLEMGAARVTGFHVGRDPRS